MCDCGLTSSCIVPKYGCNCNAIPVEWTKDTGKVTNSSQLPVMELKLGHLYNTSKSRFLLGPLECTGKHYKDKPDKTKTIQFQLSGSIKHSISPAIFTNYEFMNGISRVDLSNGMFIAPRDGAYLFMFSGQHCTYYSFICLYRYRSTSPYVKHCLDEQVHFDARILNLKDNDRVFIKYDLTKKLNGYRSKKNRNKLKRITCDIKFTALSIGGGR